MAGAAVVRAGLTVSVTALALKNDVDACLRRRGHRITWRKTRCQPQYVGRCERCETEYCVADLGSSHIGYFGYELTCCDVIRRRARTRPPVYDRWTPLQRRRRRAEHR